ARGKMSGAREPTSVSAGPARGQGDFAMRPLPILAALSVVLLAPALADAQPTTYVCTPAAQVLTVDGTSGATAVLYTGSGSFSDCVLGPDGWLYVSNGTSILRFDPTSSATALATDEFV